MKRNIVAVYIRGLAFKASSGGRREQVLRALKKADETSKDLWVLKYLLVFTGGLAAGIATAYLQWGAG